LGDLPKQGYVDLRVVGGHVDAAVTQNKANPIEGDAIAQHLGGCRVSQQMSAPCRSLDARSLKGASDHAGNTVSGDERSEWSDTAKEDAIRVVDLRPAFHITEQCIPYVLRQRQAHLVAAFAHHLERSILPVDVNKPKLGDISSS
jgi:hypothetical protein